MFLPTPQIWVVSRVHELIISLLNIRGDPLQTSRVLSMQLSPLWYSGLWNLAALFSLLSQLYILRSGKPLRFSRILPPLSVPEKKLSGSSCLFSIFQRLIPFVYCCPKSWKHCFIHFVCVFEGNLAALTFSWIESDSSVSPVYNL